MPKEADNVIITKFIMEIDEALVANTKLGEHVDNLKVKLRELVASGKDLKTASAEINEAFRSTQVDEYGKRIDGAGERIRRFGVVSRIAVRELNDEMRQSGSETINFVDRLGRLGDVARFVFGSVLGITAITVLRNIIRFLTEAGNALIEFRRNIFLLEVGVRALQRSGFDTTISEWTEQIDEFKKRFPIFPTAEIVDAFDKAILKLREYNFTQEETIKLLEVAALLSRLTGRDFGEMSDRITGAITRGWFEALQNLGIPLSRLEIMQEAYNQSLDKSFNLLDESTRAHLAYQLLLENVGDITEDAAVITEESFDRIAIANAKIADSQLELGKSSEGVIVTLKELWAGLLEIVSKVLNGITELTETYVKGFIILGSNIERKLVELSLTLVNFGISSRKVFGRSSEDLIEFRETFESQLNIIEKRLRTLSMIGEESVDGLVESMLRLGDLPPIAEAPITIGDIEFSPEEFQAIVDAAQELAEKMNEIDEEAKEKNLEIWRDWGKDRIEIWEDHTERLADLEADLANRLADIDIREQQRIDDEIANNAFRVAEAIRKANFRRQDAERKFREREIKEERKFQEKMRQLRENFLLDLEDAVRERDARQIIRLTRQYNLRRDQMIREEKLNKDDRKAQFEEELRQIEFQRQERLRQLAIENERRIEAINRQAERERNQAQIDFERRKADEADRYSEEKDKRDERRDEQLTDLQDWAQERTDEVIAGLQKEYELTEEQLGKALDLWKDYYGPEGYIAGWVDSGADHITARLMQLAGLHQMLLSRLNIQKMTFIPPGFGELDNAGGQAEGGTIIARKPTVALFGEAGPEMATFTPLNKLGTQGTTAKITPMGDSMPRDGRIQLEMLLSPDLEARVVDNTLGELADINFAIEKARK